MILEMCVHHKEREWAFIKHKQCTILEAVSLEPHNNPMKRYI